MTLNGKKTDVPKNCIPYQRPDVIVQTCKSIKVVVCNHTTNSVSLTVSVSSSPCFFFFLDSPVVYKALFFGSL